MPGFESLESLILGFPEVSVEPHFEKISFRVRRKIIATYDEQNQWATLKLSRADQDHFTSLHQAVRPVDNKWGQQGWTIVELGEADEVLLKEVLTAAYREVAPKKLAGQI